MEKGRLLWVGDAGVATGFARATHHTLDVLKKDWDVHVLGINYTGDPHDHGYPIYPCWPGGDIFGVQRLPGMVRDLRPEVVVIQNDPWNVPEYIKAMDEALADMPAKEFPLLVASMPVDGRNLKDGEKLNRLNHAIFWTAFGVNEARQGGYKGPATIIPLGIDLDMYEQVKKEEALRYVFGDAREQLGERPFIIGNVNRNQPRKRLDLTIAAFVDFMEEADNPNAYLFLYVAPTGELGYDVKQLMNYYGFGEDNKRLVLVKPPMGQGNEEKEMKYVYSSFDVQISTTQGEGWGLTTLEGMACGVPQIFPDWAALGEWAKGAGEAVPCDGIAVTPNYVNVVGGVVDHEKLVEALVAAYVSPAKRADMTEKGLKLASRPTFNWQRIGYLWNETLQNLVHRHRQEPVGQTA